MIRKLRLKIVVIIMLLLTIMTSSLMLSLNVISQLQNKQIIEDRLEKLANSNTLSAFDDISPFKNEENSYMDFFSVMLNANNQILTLTFNRDIVVQADEIIDYVNQALSTGNEKGTLGRYAYIVKYKPYGKIVVFLDISQMQAQNRNLFFTTLIMGIIAEVLSLILALGLAFWLVRPVKETLDKQKLFISNASHELKTPLAVIKANTDVLEGEIGENKWLGYIKDESTRMSELVNELLCLARLDDKSSNKMIMEDFSLSDLVLQSALPFESRMFENGKKFNVDVQPNVSFHGDKSTIQHIITILIDNAEKYSDENGEINVRLYTHGKSKTIEVYNTGRGILPEKLNKVFERFYREDEARNSKSGGYGLGLAIARSGAEAHGGSITAQSEYGKWAKFIVTL